MQLAPTKNGKPGDHFFITKLGEARFPHLITPDLKFDDKGKFSVGVALDTDGIDEARAAMTRLYRDAFPDAKGDPHLPIKVDRDGHPYLVAKSTFKPTLRNPEREEIEGDVMIRNGHPIRVLGVARAFKSSFVQGITLYLNAVEIHPNPADPAPAQDDTDWCPF